MTFQAGLDIEGVPVTTAEGVIAEAPKALYDEMLATVKAELSAAEARAAATKN